MCKPVASLCEVACLGATLVTLASCATPSISDLKLISATIEDYRQTPLARDDLRGERSQTLLHIRISSSINPRTIERDPTWGYTAVFCRNPDKTLRLSLGHPIFYHGQALRFEMPSGPSEAIRNDDTPQLYDVYLRTADYAEPNDIPPHRAWDIRDGIDDICLRFDSGAYRAFGWHSNTITIPRALTAQSPLLTR
jgi:hypothetical protein